MFGYERSTIAPREQTTQALVESIYHRDPDKPLSERRACSTDWIRRPAAVHWSAKERTEPDHDFRIHRRLRDGHVGILERQA